MIVPSILTTAIGAAALIACAALLRYVANEARELTRTRARASDSAKPVSVSSFSPKIRMSLSIVLSPIELMPIGEP